MNYALGAALYHNVRLVDDTRPIESILDCLFPRADGISQFCVPHAAKKERRTSFQRQKLLARVRGNELFSFLVRATVESDPDTLMVGFQLAPATLSALEGLAGYLYRFDLVAGARTLARLGAAAVVDAVVALARLLAPRAGVVLTAESASFADALATGASGGLTPEQDARVRDVFYSVQELGDKIRGPEWGTFLGAHHVAKLGGLERVAEICERVERFEHGGAFLQLTKQPPVPADASFEAQLAKLAALLAPLQA